MIHSLCTLILGLAHPYALATSMQSAADSSAASAPSSSKTYAPTWQSLKQYEAPDWYRDAKFGIWAHWGPQAVPEEGDWYARNMYVQGSPQYESHLKNYGHPSVHGYREIIEMWKAEKWNPDRLMRLYKAAGAKYFFSMGVHHDNFDLWNSRYHLWNAVLHGPHKDVVGLWQKAAKKYGLKFGVSEHLGASYTWWASSKGSDSEGPLKGVPYDGADPNYQDLYHPLPKASDRGWYTTNEAWFVEWYKRINDLVSRYRPDLLYSDGGVPFGNYGRQTIANLYNQDNQAVYLAKNLQTGEFQEGAFVEDRERGGAQGIQKYPWQVDTSIGDWFYNKHWPYRKADWVLTTLIDVVSKNGNLLLNVVLRPDGSLDPEVETLLADLAAWMKVNGESLFGTRPWITYGEGPTKVSNGSFREDFPFSAKDIRYVTKGAHTLYASFMGPVSDQEATLRSLGQYEGVTAQIKSVHLLGSPAELAFHQTSGGLVVKVPVNQGKYATVLKIECSDVNDFKPDEAPSTEPVVTRITEEGGVLKPEDADLGDGLSIELRTGQYT